MIKRYIELNQLVSESSIFLFGPRGVGKSSLVENYIEEGGGVTINLLHLAEITRYRSNPSLFRDEIERELRKRTTCKIFVDEIQLLPEILNEVHFLIEKYKDRVRFILTGSSARKLKRSEANLLAGRAIDIRLHPISNLEEPLDLYRALRFGTLPKPYLSNSDPTDMLRSYVNTYLKEEILQEALVRKSDTFVRFLELAAQLNGKHINFSKLAKSLKIAVTTVQEYFSILVDTLIATRLDSWSHSVKKQLISSPKYYLFDCGIINAINKTLSVPVHVGTFHFGALFETLVVNEIIHHRDYLRKDFTLNHYRTTTDREIDIIINRGPFIPPIAIEIKSEEAPSEFPDLEAFKTDYPESKVYCIANTLKDYQVGNVNVVPWREGIKEIVESA